MAWSDEPTYGQINTVYRWLSWGIPNAMASTAANWLRDHATRQEVSNEMKRMKVLFDKHALNQDTAFDSEVWEGF